MIEFKTKQISEDHWDIYIKGDVVYKIRRNNTGQKFTLHDIVNDVMFYRFRSPYHAMCAAIKQIMGG